MNPICQGRSWLVYFVAASVMICSAAAQSATNSPTSSELLLIPPPNNPLPASPVVYFRKLLAMSPQQLESALAKKSPAVRERILAKVNEYSALDPDERELRLRATDLRWYLTLLLQAPAEQRTPELATVPEDIRDLVQSRLDQWEMLPPEIQQEFLDNEHILGYFSGVGDTNNPTDASKPTDAEQSRWNTLPDNERQGMIAQFDEFFELSAAEKQKALGDLSATERAQMQTTLQAFDKLSPRERAQCIHAFGKFTGMSRIERAEFLKNAERWSRMTSSERKAWRDLVAHVPEWPALPPGFVPPSPPPPSPPQDAHALAATNRG
jgi:hypothetical protein